MIKVDQWDLASASHSSVSHFEAINDGEMGRRGLVG
jgi:hypothetical protein